VLLEKQALLTLQQLAWLRQVDDEMERPPDELQRALMSQPTKKTKPAWGTFEEKMSEAAGRPLTQMELFTSLHEGGANPSPPRMRNGHEDHNAVHDLEREAAHHSGARAVEDIQLTCRLSWTRHSR
jgi:hypothetical protein